MTPEEYQKINLLPDKDASNIKRVASILGIKDELIYVDVIPDGDAIFGECCTNVLRKVEQSKGEVIYGWRFCEFSYMIEAEFHAIWKSPKNKLIDVTPSEEKKTSKILFAIDRNKKFDGSRTDNFRLNTTSNELVDDIIEIEKAKFRFKNKAEKVDKNGIVLMNKVEGQVWQNILFCSYEVEELFAFNGTINSLCFCGSTVSYQNCHRNSLRQFLKSI